MLINEMIDKYEREVLPSLRPQTQRDYAWHLARLRVEFGLCDVDLLRPKDVGMFLAQPDGPVSRNRSMSVLSSIYSYAVGRWWIAEKNPCSKVMRNPTKPRDRYVMNHEYEAMRSVCSPMLQIAMDLALLTGQRQGDILTRTREHEYPEGVFFDQSKTGKKLIVGLTDTLKGVMLRSRHMDIPGRFFVIRNNAGELFTSAGFRSNWQRAMKIALRTTALKNPFHFHDLRAKCVSDEKDKARAQLRAGHQTMAMTMRVYNRGIDIVPALR